MKPCDFNNTKNYKVSLSSQARKHYIVAVGNKPIKTVRFRNWELLIELKNKPNKMEKEINIKIPEGYEIDKENSTFECIKFKKIKKTLPKSWTEYIRKNIGKETYFINDFSIIKRSILYNYKDKNTVPKKEQAEGILALTQLISLRDEYRQGWTPDWEDKKNLKHGIKSNNDSICKTNTYGILMLLSFQSEEIRDEFFENFKDILEIAKDFI